MFTHFTLGFCAWDIPTLILLLATVVVFLVHRDKQIKREREFEDELTNKLAEKTMNAADAENSTVTVKAVPNESAI